MTERNKFMSKIGYIRVSTEHQETTRQQEILSSYQVDRIFSEKLSGVSTDRPQLKAMLDYVREGDTLYVESISRLGRSAKDLLNTVFSARVRSCVLCFSTSTMASKAVSTAFFISPTMLEVPNTIW